jgi:iron complex outermembrane receptor protein
MRNSQAKRELFRVQPVVVGCMLVALAATAQAQEQAAEKQSDNKLETVTVTGIRKSIESAISVKRNADGIVEAISAEDLGKLPDISIADSIARLPGVAAQRNGEGRASQLSVRGMPPDFATTLLNGREQVNPNDGRGAEFDAYPTELIGGVLLYKTPDASLMGQGIAGTVDLQTVRPLAFNGRRGMIGLTTERNSVGQGPNGKANTLSLSYIDQFNNKTLGVALGFVRKKGDSTGREVNSFDDSGTFSGGVKMPFQVSVTEATRMSEFTRDGLMGVIELKATADFTSTLDLFASRTDRRTLGHQVAFPKFNTGTLSDAVIVDGVAVAGKVSGVKAIVQTIGQHQKDENLAAGWNNKIRINEQWSAVVDLSHSQSKRRETDIDSNASTGGTGVLSFDTRGSYPSFSYSADLTNPATLVLANTDWGNGWLKKPSVKDTLDTLRVDVKRNLDSSLFSAFNIGASYGERKKTLGMTEGSLSFKNGGTSATLPSSSVVRAGLSNINILGWDSLDLIDTVYTYTDMGSQTWAIMKNWKVNEKVANVFGKLDIDSNWWGLPVRGNLGLQVVHTKQNSTGLNDATVATWDDNGTQGGQNVYVVKDTSPQTAGRSYTDVLPSLNLIFDIGNSQNLRLGMGKMMARPTMRDMRANTIYECWSPASNPKSCSGNHSGSGGNPLLDPFRATTFDLAYEKYFDKRAYVGGAAFYKDLDTFIYQESFKSDVIASKYGLSGYPTLDYSGPKNGKGGKIYGWELTLNAPFDLVSPMLSGFGAYISHSDTHSSVNIPNSAGGSATTMGLPGLSRRVTNLSVYYEKNGFSARVGNRIRSDFIGEYTTNEYERKLTYVKGESILDLQLGYEFREGSLKGLSLTLQANNVTDAKFQKYRLNADGNKEISSTAQYGKAYSLGATYRY